METADHPSGNREVLQQYETFPYPVRVPADEESRIQETLLENISAIRHYCFGGMQDFRNGFRALVAGGGTGDSTIYLARQLQETDATIVHLDISEPSLEVARQRARYAKVEERITFLNGSLLDLPSMELDSFDYINCTGVLHHLADHEAGLAALRSVLKPDGAIGIMLYGRYGRTGVYQMQELLRHLNRYEPDMQQRVDNTRSVLAALPPTNWLKPREAEIRGEISTDPGIYDLLLHSRDRAYTMPEVHSLLDTSSLKFVEFGKDHRSMYNPYLVFSDAEVRRQLDKLTLPERQWVGELYWGTIGSHLFWASPREPTVAESKDPDQVPFFPLWSRKQRLQEKISAASESHWHFKLMRSDRINISYVVNLDAVTREFLTSIDGRQTTGQLLNRIVRNRKPRVPASSAWQSAIGALDSLRDFDIVLLRGRHVAPLNGE